MDILRLTLQSELTGDELEHIAQKVSRCLPGQGLLSASSFLLLTVHPSVSWTHFCCCKPESISLPTHPASSASCFGKWETPTQMKANPSFLLTFPAPCPGCCLAALGGQRNLCVGRGQEVLVAVWFLSPFSLSLRQAGRTTYAMVSDRSSGHSLASELVESHDGHEEIIKVSLVHSPFFFLLSPPCRYTKELLIDSSYTDWSHQEDASSRSSISYRGSNTQVQPAVSSLGGAWPQEWA